MAVIGRLLAGLIFAPANVITSSVSPLRTTKASSSARYSTSFHPSKLPPTLIQPDATPPAVVSEKSRLSPTTNIPRNSGGASAPAAQATGKANRAAMTTTETKRRVLIEKIAVAGNG